MRATACALHLDQWAVRSAEPATSPTQGGAVALSLREEKYFVLNGTAAAIWRRLERPITLRRLAAELAAEFAVAPETAGAAVLTFVAELAEQRIVEVQDKAFEA